MKNLKRTKFEPSHSKQPVMQERPSINRLTSTITLKSRQSSPDYFQYATPIARTYDFPLFKDSFVPEIPEYNNLQME